MFGVVLWHCARRQKAVVWCEDQGDLAYYDADGTDFEEDIGNECALHVGDLWQFDVTERGGRRYVDCPQILARGSPLAAHLLAAASAALPQMSQGLNPEPAVAPMTVLGQILPFPGSKRAAKVDDRKAG